MPKTDTFRRQHEELLGLIGAIEDLLTPELVRREGGRIRQLLTTLGGKLGIHLAMEDKSLYPTLLGSDDPRVQRLTQEFIEEMGGIAGAFRTYKNRWPSAASIEANAAVFIDDTKSIFAALERRIERENEELYPLADAG